MSKMWGGCFTQETSLDLKTLNSSINVDKRLWSEDITASQTYSLALYRANVITKSMHSEIFTGLDTIRREWENNAVVILDDDEDIHSVNERRLKELIGETAEHLHTGRSRNDQVATDFRLWIFIHGQKIKDHISGLIKTIVAVARREIDVLMPGYTHLKRAQPVRFSHFILSHAWSFRSDYDLLNTILDRTAILPLGSGALAGNAFSVDRELMATDLGFKGVTMNSMNAVGNRDFVAEMLFWFSLCGTHLSRLAEDLIIFSTDEFGYLEISQKYSTGSSLLPQKRNPDGLELTRGAAAQFIGNVTTFLTVLKGLPSTYNKDLQCDKETIFNSYDLIRIVFDVVEGTIRTMKVNEKRCHAALEPTQLAVRLANYLVKNGLPFRQAHHLAGRALALAEDKKVPLDQLSKDDLMSLSDSFAGDMREVWNYEAAVEECQSIGGTARSSVMEQIKILQHWTEFCHSETK